MDFTILLKGLTESLIYSILWILIMYMSYFVLQKMINTSIKKEIIEDENISLWIIFAWFFIAIAIIISSSIR
jgi:hypothetical protein